MTADAETIEGLRADNERLRRRVAELEETLRRRELIAQGVIDHTPAIIYVTDTDWNILLINRQGAALVGHDREQIVGRPDAAFFPKDVVEAWHDNDRRMIASGEAITVEESAPHEDGVHTHRSIKFPVHTAEGEVFALGGVSVDITEQRRAEQRLRESEANAQAMINASTDALLLLDADGRVVAANEAAARHNGRSVDEITGMRDAFPLEDPARRAALIEEAARTKRPLFLEEQRAGSWFDVAIYPIAGAGGDVERLSVFARDVTERLRAEREQRHLQAQIIEAQRRAIQEMSTPIIPLTADAVVVPVVGSMDTARAQQIMEAMLAGVAGRGASAVIVDVTGASVLGTEVADALLRAARAVKLLGATVVMTGISPHTAQALVHAGVSFEEIVTLGSLQDGIAYALKRRGR